MADFRCLFSFLFFLIIFLATGNDREGVIVVNALGFNWGTRATHPLPPDIVVKLMKDNGINKVKLFEAEPWVLRALGNSGIEVMVGIPNDFLAPFATSVRAAEDWVSKNVSAFISKYGVDIRYVAVGNEPFLKTYKDAYLQTTFPALKNIQAALIRAGLGRQVKVTVPLNADVYESDTGVPSGGNFRPDIHNLMISLIKFLRDSASPITINIYPFLSLYADPHFPVDFAFFSGNATPVVDGSFIYSNVFDANFDTLVSALEKNGLSSIPIIIGEIGWPTDGDINANKDFARRFNQGLLNRIIQGQGSPKRPKSLPEIYFFGLVDEDAKSILPGNFERHWGIFNYDGTTKYELNIGSGKSLVPAKGVRYLARQWCIMAPQASLSDPNLAKSVIYACEHADCTSLGYGSSCGGLDAKSNASYAFNMYYQTMNQTKGSCDFNNLSIVSSTDPSRDNTCRFEIMIDLGKHKKAKSRTINSAGNGRRQSLDIVVMFLLGLIAVSVL